MSNEASQFHLRRAGLSPEASVQELLRRAHYQDKIVRSFRYQVTIARIALRMAITIPCTIFVGYVT